VIVSHGSGGKAEGFANIFAPFASVFESIMVFPQANGKGDQVSYWDNTGYTGPLFNTKNGV
jgi:hypothetical protein